MPGDIGAPRYDVGNFSYRTDVLILEKTRIDSMIDGIPIFFDPLIEDERNV